MMPGMIMLWYGSIATIPSGWALCNGNNGTPNLSDKFVLGASPVYSPPGETGGITNHQHDFIGDGHAHDLASGDDIINSSPDGHFGHLTTTNPASGTTNSGSNLPPYHALCYIMKLPIP